MPSDLQNEKKWRPYSHHNYMRLNENILQYNSLQRVSAHWKYSFHFFECLKYKAELDFQTLIPKVFLLKHRWKLFFPGQ